MELTDDQASWFSSLAALGLPIGTLGSGFLMNVAGRKWSAVLFHGLTNLVGFALIATADSVEQLYCGRILCGICQVSRGERFRENV